MLRQTPPDPAAPPLFLHKGLQVPAVQITVFPQIKASTSLYRHSLLLQPEAGPSSALHTEPKRALEGNTIFGSLLLLTEAFVIEPGAQNNPAQVSVMWEH